MDKLGQNESILISDLDVFFNHQCIHVVSVVMFCLALSRVQNFVAA